jgi:hypothetical protein
VNSRRNPIIENASGEKKKKKKKKSEQLPRIRLLVTVLDSQFARLDWRFCAVHGLAILTATLVGGLDVGGDGDALATRNDLLLAPILGGNIDQLDPGEVVLAAGGNARAVRARLVLVLTVVMTGQRGPAGAQAGVASLRRVRTARRAAVCEAESLEDAVDDGSDGRNAADDDDDPCLGRGPDQEARERDYCGISCNFLSGGRLLTLLTGNVCRLGQGLELVGLHGRTGCGAIWEKRG